MNRFTLFPRRTQKVIATTRNALLAFTAPLMLGLIPAVFAQTAATTTTTMTLTSGGSPTTSVSSGTAITLTATVLAGATPVTTGLVNFCDATATYCEDVHIAGSAQLTSAGTAVVKFRPGVGSRSYKAVFVGTTANATSSSAAVGLTVTGPYRTATGISETNQYGYYQLNALVGSPGTVAPTGTVVFENQTNGNAILGSQTLSGSPLAGVTLIPPSQSVYANSLIAIGDFNGDGIPDLAAAPYVGSTVAILLGNGDGTFTQAGTSIPLGGTPSAVVAADFNGDGKIDLAIVNVNATLTVLLGNGDGTFHAAATTTGTTLTNAAILTGDLNRDGVPDLVLFTSTQTVATAQVLLGNGDGTFKANASFIVTTTSEEGIAGNFPASPQLALGDVNGDGIPDLVFVGSAPVGDPWATFVEILTGKGDGTFSQPLGGADVNTTAPAGPFVLADFNGDGNLDVAFGDTTDETATVLFGNGQGQFSDGSKISGPPLSSPGPGAAVTAIVVGDFNGDGIADLAISYFAGTQVFEGTGNGSFSTGGQLAEPVTEAAADFNGDGLTDLASSVVSVLLSDTQVQSETVTGITLLATGPQNVIASYSGDSTHSGSVSGPLALAPLPSINLTASATNLTTIQQTTLTATLSPFTGTNDNTNGETIYFLQTIGPSTTTYGMATLANGIATGTINPLPAGQYEMYAFYQGDTLFGQSTSPPLEITVIKQSTTLTLTTTPQNSVAQNATLTLTATLSPYSGNGIATDGEKVYFFNGTSTTPLATAILAGGVATATIGPLSGGQYSISATYDGDATFLASQSGSVPISVVGQATTLALTLSPTTATYGSPVTMTATLSPYTSGGVSSNGNPITFVTGTSTIGTGALASGVLQLTTTYLPVGTDQVQAEYGGNSILAGSTSPAVSISITPAPLTVTAASATRLYGAPNPAFTGSASGAVNGDLFTVTAATTATQSSPPGTYPIVPVASGTNLADYSVTTVNGTLTVTAPPASIGAIAASANPAMAGSPVTFTVSVTSQNGTPTGTVTFLDGSTPLGTGTLTSGSATYTTSALTAGTHSITASYAGDTNFGAVTSAVLSEVIESFSVGGSSGGSTTQTTSPGGTATYALSVTPPTAGDPITFSVTGLPSGATATFTPSTIPVGAGPTNVSLVVTLPSTAAAQPVTNLFRNSAIPISLALVLLPFAGRLRKGSRRWLWIVILGAAGLAGMGACGGGGNSGGGGGGGSTPQNYTLTVTATSGTLTQTTTLTLTVN